MIRRLPAVSTGLQLRLTDRERQRADLVIKDTPHALRVDRQLAELKVAFRKLRDVDGIELQEEGTAAVGKVWFNGTTGVSARRIR